MNPIHKQRLCLMVIGLILYLGTLWVSPSTAEARTHNIKWSDNWHAPRARVLFHNAKPMEEFGGIERRIHVVCPNVNADELNGLAYLGFNLPFMRGAELEPVIGYNFRGEHWIASARWSSYNGTTPRSSSWYFWADAEYTFGAKEVYYFAQLDFPVLNWLDLGFESEGWGISTGNESIGGGVNAIIHTMTRGGSRFQADLAVHYRDLDELDPSLDTGWKPEFFLRFHLIPKLDL